MKNAKTIQLNEEQLEALKKSLFRHCNQLEGWADNAKKSLINARQFQKPFDEKKDGEFYRNEIQQLNEKFEVLNSILEQL